MFGVKFLAPHMSMVCSRDYTYPATFIWAAGYDYSNIHRQIIAKLPEKSGSPLNRINLWLGCG